MTTSKKTKAELTLERLNMLKMSPLCSDIGFEVMIDKNNCAEEIIRRLPGMGKLDLKVLEIRTQLELVPFGAQRHYKPDSVIKARSRKTGKIIYINIEMQNDREGTQLNRTRSYSQALMMYFAESGISWNDFPEVITVMFTKHIPIGENLYYYEDGLYGEGVSTEESTSLLYCGPSRVMYINMNLHEATELLENRPDLRPAAEVTHDLIQTKSCNMIIKELRDYKKNLEEEQMERIGNIYPIDRYVNRLLEENTISVTEAVTESITTTLVQNLYRKGIDIATIASYLDKSESEIEKYLTQSLE